jgi:hypothetical protein
MAYSKAKFKSNGDRASLETGNNAKKIIKRKRSVKDTNRKE